MKGCAAADRSPLAEVDLGHRSRDRSSGDWSRRHEKLGEVAEVARTFWVDRATVYGLKA
jgi:hypothetical protein